MHLTESSQAHLKQNEIDAGLQGWKPDSLVISSTRNDDRNAGPGDGSSIPLDLPPLQQVLPFVHLFIEKVNAVIPLFHAKCLLRLVHDSYNLSPIQRDPVAWAAVNVVLGLTHRKGLVGVSSVKEAVGYLNKAQSVLPDVMLGEIQVLNIQVLVGIVMLLEGSEDLQPSLILIATTIRLAHGIGLHNRHFSAHLDPVLARQRSYVFWIAYILDKDLSLRSKQPSIQVDDDIDLDLPSSPLNELPIDNVAGINEASASPGIITTMDGAVKMDYLVTRIQLAVIEGGVYDYIFSTRAQKRSPEERSCALESVAQALEQWKTSVPPEFKAAEASRKASPDSLGLLCVLSATSLMCTTCINQANFMNAKWVGSLRNYGKDGTVPVLPPQWEELVDEVRNFMVLFGQLAVIDRWNWW